MNKFRVIHVLETWDGYACTFVVQEWEPDCGVWGQYFLMRKHLFRDAEPPLYSPDGEPNEYYTLEDFDFNDAMERYLK